MKRGGFSHPLESSPLVVDGLLDTRHLSEL